MIVSINQPAYLPWLGYFHRIAVSHAHVILDSVQFEKNSVTNRNKIRTPQGWCWLTVPLQTKGRFGNLPIHQIEIFNTRPWSAKHWQSLKTSYARAPYFPEHARFFERLYARRWEKLIDLVREATDYMLDAFAIKTPRRYSSQMAAEGRKDTLVLNLCKSLGATTYLSGPFGRDYLDETKFGAEGIRIHYHDYKHPEYKQCQPGFEPGMSALDLLFNHGPECMKILSAGQEPPTP